MSTTASHKDRGFDRIARVYDWLAWMVFGGRTRKAQQIYIHRIPRKAKVLILGGGTGWLAKKILKKRPDIHIIYVEASPRMIKIAQNKLKNFKRNIDYRLGNERRLIEMEPVDVVITPFILDVFDEKRLKDVFWLLDQALIPGGTWIFTDFVIPHGRGRNFARVLIWAMYRFFRIICGIPGKKLLDFERYFRYYKYQCMDDELFFLNMIQAQWLVKPLENALSLDAPAEKKVRVHQSSGP